MRIVFPALRDIILRGHTSNALVWCLIEKSRWFEMVVFGGELSQSEARVMEYDPGRIGCRQRAHRATPWLLAAALAFAASAVGHAQYAPQPPQPGYPAQPSAPPQPAGYDDSQQMPSNQPQANARAARLTYLAGDVHIDSAAGAGDEAAALNMPIVEGMVVATGDNGQAELEFEDGSLVRLTPNSAVSLINLSIDSKGTFVTRLALLPGLAYLELRASTKYQFSVDAGGDVISPVENSAVRVDFDEPPAKIAVLDGSIRVVSQAGISASAVSGQTIREAYLPTLTQSQPQAGGQYPSQNQPPSSASSTGALPATVYGQPVGPGGDGAAPGYAIDQPSPGQNGQYPPGAQGGSQPVAGSGRFLIKDSLEPNSWDQWNEDRDQAAANDASNQTAARTGFAGDQGYGWSDLDANGSWYNVPGQGQVWQPDAAAQSGDDSGANSGADSFDPYGYGNWVFTAGYGYVWASGYSWGWTPFRCGTWGYYGGFGWGWSPGYACGLPAYGGRGYDLNFNRRLVPLTYRPPSKPNPGPAHNHPPVIVNGGLAPLSPPHLTPTTRVIAGHKVQPLTPVGGGYTPRGGSAVGSALLRDYPVNRTTRTPVVGVLPSHDAPALSARVYHASSWRPTGTPSSGAPASNMLPATGRRFSYTPRTSDGQSGGTQNPNGPRGTYQSGGRPSSPQLPITVLGTPSPRDPYEPGEGVQQRPQTPGGAPVYRTQPASPAYGYHPAPGYPAHSGETNSPGYTPSYRQPPAPPVQRATPPPASPSRPAPVPASSGPGKG